MALQLTISGSGLRRTGVWLARLVLLVLVLLALAAVIRWGTRPRDGFVTSIPSSHYVSVQMTNGSTYYGRVHAVRDDGFVRLSSVKVLANQPSSRTGATPTIGITSQKDTLLDRAQIVAVVDIGTHPAAEG